MNLKCTLLTAALGLTLALATVPVVGQQPAEIVKIGALMPGVAPPPGTPSLLLVPFREGMAEFGYAEGETFLIEERWQPPGKADWLADAIAELEEADVKVIFAGGAIPARAVKATNSEIPTVFVMIVPTTEFVSQPDRPEGNLTGFTTFDPELARQQLEILREILPGVTRIAYLGDEAVGEAPYRLHESAAHSLGLEPLIQKVRASEPDYDAVFEEIGRDGADALVLLEHPIIGVQRRTITEYAARNGLPTVLPRLFADTDGLFAYGTPLSAASKPAAAYIDNIIQGASPAELPVQTIHAPELIINLPNARQLGVTIPNEVLNKATRVIQ